MSMSVRWFALACLLVACGDDGPQARVAPVTCAATAPTSCPDPPPRYADVAPVVAKRCVPCHFGLENGPWPLVTYGEIVDWADVIRGDLLSCSMPPPDGGVTLEEPERQVILAWLRCGHPR
jgi:hypothetical protein